MSRGWWPQLAIFARRRRPIIAGIAITLLLFCWLLPFNGQLILILNTDSTRSGPWPQFWVEPPIVRAGEQVALYVRDDVPWSHVKLLVDGIDVPRDSAYPAGNGPWSWRWLFRAPASAQYDAFFYHSCDRGCVQRGMTSFGAVEKAATADPAPVPTKLGVVFTNPNRAWHGKAGWTVELTYVLRQDDIDFSIDGLAQRVQLATRQGLRVLVRIAYDRGQALPPVGDEVALADYLRYCARLARDERLLAVYAYIIGSSYNSKMDNRLTPERPTTPEWYARLLNGYDTPVARHDNVVETMKRIRPQLRLLVGPVLPWSDDQDGALPSVHNQPWLNYFNTLVAHIDQTTRTKSGAGILLAAPDGFALIAAGRPEASSDADTPAHEPARDIHRTGWGEAQAGFRIYRDWLAIINAYPSTQGLPAYITSANTFAFDENRVPAQNYPTGWLTTALAEINRVPQIHALCWFVDDPLDGQWAAFSLSQPQGAMNDAAQEFDRLVQKDIQTNE